jgi:hypothetical protein
LEFWHDGIVRIGSNESGGCEPASEVRFEGIHIGGASKLGFASDFVGDVIREEGIKGRVEEVVNTVFPDSGAIGLADVSKEKDME